MGKIELAQKSNVAQRKIIYLVGVSLCLWVGQLKSKLKQLYKQAKITKCKACKALKSAAGCRIDKRLRL